MTDGYVYVIEAIGTERYKIGCSSDPIFRQRALSSLSPFPLQLKHRVYSLNARDLEKMLHIKFQQKRLHGEWFALSEEEVKLAFNLMDECSDEEDQEVEQSPKPVFIWFFRGKKIKFYADEKKDIYFSNFPNKIEATSLVKADLVQLSLLAIKLGRDIYLKFPGCTRGFELGKWMLKSNQPDIKNEVLQSNRYKILT